MGIEINSIDRQETKKNDHHISKKAISIGLLELTENNLIFENYNIDKYLEHVNNYGLEITWAHILYFVQENDIGTFLNPLNFGEMYEIGLAELDKGKKKKSGQYYTPTDVSKLMASWLLDLSGINICDVGCGTGNLILSFLELVSKKEAIDLIKNGRIYLYDFDKIAITIAQYSIALLFGFEYLNNINVIYGDFLSSKIVLPPNSKIISNPPYAKIDKLKEDWSKSKIQSETKELYASFMEKIILSSNQSVIITPYSFLGGSKFERLRKMMCEYNGYIVAFDNVPGNIFNGRKQGIFNTNTANSVRAAITVVENVDQIKGFRTTHLIRFKNAEREELLQPYLLKNLLSHKYQIINSKTNMFARCHVQLEDCFENWKTMSSGRVLDFISKGNSESNFTLYMPNTCRYYTTASRRELKRGGYMTISLDDIDKFNYMYCLINSSFVYWWWRIFDGGITYPKGLLYSMPIFFNLLTTEDKKFFSQTACEMISNENSYVITKKNAGDIQENIKFPKKYRDSINARLLGILSCPTNVRVFDLVHTNSFFGELTENNDD